MSGPNQVPRPGPDPQAPGAPGPQPQAGWPQAPQGGWSAPQQGGWQPPADPSMQQPPAQGGWAQPQGGWQQSAPPQPPSWQQPPQQPGWTPPPPPSSWAPPPPAGPSTGISYADFLIRLVAYIIDGIILIIPGAILTAALVTNSVRLNLSTGQVEVNVAGLLIVTVIQFAISAAYFIYTWTTMRASPGQKILGMMVLNEADGRPITMNQAVTRWAVLAGPAALSNLVTGWSGLGTLLGLLVVGWYIYLAYTTATDLKRQGAHDKFAHTVVVRGSIQ
jgi:uncharacterized RDD family membrane protein YckC